LSIGVRLIWNMKLFAMKQLVWSMNSFFPFFFKFNFFDSTEVMIFFPGKLIKSQVFLKKYSQKIANIHHNGNHSVGVIDWRYISLCSNWLPVFYYFYLFLFLFFKVFVGTYHSWKWSTRF
jgi:hypothetical protein